MRARPATRLLHIAVFGQPRYSTILPNVCQPLIFTFYAEISFRYSVHQDSNLHYGILYGSTGLMGAADAVARAADMATAAPVTDHDRKIGKSGD